MELALLGAEHWSFAEKKAMVALQAGPQVMNFFFS
jgi:hypothetical protein